MLARLDDIFDDLFYPISQNSLNRFSDSKSIFQYSSLPRIKTLDGKIQLFYDVPAVKLEDLDITSENQKITIKAKRYDTQEVATYQYLLASKYDASTVTAQLADGLLTLEILVREESKAKKIKILPK